MARPREFDETAVLEGGDSVLLVAGLRGHFGP